jgi:hypothetical protein
MVQEKCFVRKVKYNKHELRIIFYAGIITFFLISFIFSLVSSISKVVLDIRIYYDLFLLCLILFSGSGLLFYFFERKVYWVEVKK